MRVVMHECKVTELIIGGLRVLHVPAWEVDWIEGEVHQGVGCCNSKGIIIGHRSKETRGVQRQKNNCR